MTIQITNQFLPLMTAKTKLPNSLILSTKEGEEEDLLSSSLNKFNVYICVTFNYTNLPERNLSFGRSMIKKIKSLQYYGNGYRNLLFSFEDEDTYTPEIASEVISLCEDIAKRILRYS